MLLLFMRRMVAISNVDVITKELTDDDEIAGQKANGIKDVPEGVEVYEINGPFFFGAASKFKEAMSRVENPPKIRILRMRNVPAIDATGLNLLNELVSQSKREGTHLIFSGVHKQPLNAFEQYGLVQKVGRENIFGNIEDALKRANIILTELQHNRD